MCSSDGDGTLSVAALHTAAVKELANDVTVTGAMEPTVYWNEVLWATGRRWSSTWGAAGGSGGRARGS